MISNREHAKRHDVSSRLCIRGGQRDDRCVSPAATAKSRRCAMWRGSLVSVCHSNRNPARVSSGSWRSAIPSIGERNPRAAIGLGFACLLFKAVGCSTRTWRIARKAMTGPDHTRARHSAARPPQFSVMVASRACITSFFETGTNQAVWEARRVFGTMCPPRFIHARYHSTDERASSSRGRATTHAPTFS